MDQIGNGTAGRSSGEAPQTDIFGVTIETSEERSMRVEQIRREIAEGSYEVSGEAVADAILRFFSRGA